MSRHRWLQGLAIAALAASACGGGDDDDTAAFDGAPGPDAGGVVDAATPEADAAPMPDAGPTPDAEPSPDAELPTTACDTFEAPAGTISTYPGTFAGDINDGTELVDAADSACATVNAPFGVGAPGREQIVTLTGLTGGATYGVEVDAAYDASFYVATACTGAGGPAAGECLTYVDTFANPETGTFTQPIFIAPTAGVAYVVVDHWDTTAPTNGTYTLTVAEVECVDHFDCTAPGAVVCDEFVCVAGPSACLGDDPSPPEDDDDGPAGATPLPLDTPISGFVCNEPALESDFYIVSLAAPAALYAELVWPAAAEDLDLRLFDAGGTLLAASASSDPIERITVPGLAAADYYLQVDKFETYAGGMPTTSTAVSSYTVTAHLAECLWSGDCTTSGSPVCHVDATCIGGYSDCVGDDGVEDDDDGAGLAKLVEPALDGAAVEVDAHICSSPSAGTPGSSRERDWYSVALGGPEILGVALSWPGTEDLDIAVHDATGALVAEAATSASPEMLTASLGAGVYYIAVDQHAPVGVTTAAQYRVSVQRSTAP